MTPAEFFESISSGITGCDRSLEPEVKKAIDSKTKPPGSLGMLEEIAAQASLIQKSLNPAINKKRMFVFAGDHGITDEGVSAFPQEVTQQMIANFCQGGAGINVFCRQHHISINIIDSGVKGDLKPHPLLIDKKTDHGTRNFLKEKAMTKDQAIDSIVSGMECVLEVDKTEGFEITGFGEMGIGNTTSASAVTAAVLGIPPEKTAGKGTGIDDEMLKHKIDVIKKGLDLHKPNSKDGLDILSAVGGFEIGGIAGGILAAASLSKIVVLDGLISTAGGLIAALINPNVKDYLVSGHKSVEAGHTKALSFLGLKPVLDLNFRLGEGTGAALTISLVDSACRMMTEMSTFESAGVSDK